jgi:hypothetical protein
VIYILNLEINIISIERIKKDNAIRYINSISHNLFDLRINQFIEIITVESDLSTVGGKILTSKFGIRLYYAETRLKGITIDFTHRRLGHFNELLIQQLANGMATGLTLIIKKLTKRCPHCIVG